MKSIIAILMITVSSACFSYDDRSLGNEVKAEGFVVGSDNDLGGQFFYIVDKTNGLCFAGISKSHAAGGSGLVKVDCEKLKKTPSILNYINKK